MTRLWPQGEEIEVVQDGHGLPLAFTWQGRRHDVAHLTQQWRVDAGWWHDHIRRAYYKLSTHTGLLVVLYHTLPDGPWYLQRLYD